MVAHDGLPLVSYEVSDLREGGSRVGASRYYPFGAILYLNHNGMDPVKLHDFVLCKVR